MRNALGSIQLNPKWRPWPGAVIPVVLVLALGATEGFSRSDVPSRFSLPTLTSAAQVRKLTPAQAALGYPVRLHAVVTFYDRDGTEGPDLFVQDSTAGIWVDMAGMRFDLRARQLIELNGFTSFADFAPQIIRPSIRVLGPSSLPAPRRVSFERLASTAEDSQWVEFEGIVRRAEVRSQYLVLDIAAGGGRLKAYVLGASQAVPEQLVDALVRVRGACGAVFNPKNQMTGVRLNVPSLAEILVREAPAPDPFAIPRRSISSLLRFNPRGTSGHRVRIQGAVTLQRRDGTLFVVDGSDSVSIKTLEAVLLHPGDRVEVLGFPSLGEFSAQLEDAVVRKTGRDFVPAPAKVTAAQALQGNYDRHLVWVEARLVDIGSGGNGLTLTLKSQESIFEAHLEEAGSVRELSSLPLGSGLQVTGVCSVQGDENRQPRAFQLLLRSAADVVIVQKPSWWTLRRAVLGIGIMGALILGALAWVVLLRRQVEDKTAAILEWGQREVAMRERFRELFENANDVIFTCGLRGHITSLNLAGERITGFTRPEAIGHNILEWVSTEHRPVMERALLSTTFPQQTPLEIDVITKNGRRIPLEVSVRPIFSGEYRVGVQGIARDVFERKRVEHALRTSEEKFRALAETANDAIITADQAGNIIHWNKGAERTFGYPAGKILGKPLTLIMPERFRDTHRQGMREYHSTKAARAVGKTVEVEGQRNDGSEFPIELSLASWKTGEGTFFTSIIRDITDRKRAEAELRKAKEAAEAAARAKSTFLANMSHEIRTPINGITGMANLLQGTPLNPEQLDYLRMLESSANSLLRLIEDILDFSKIEAGKLELDALNFDLRKRVREDLKTLTTKAQQKGLEFSFLISPDVPVFATADPDRLRQVIVNLVGNAIKFTERGKVTLTVVTDSKTADEVWLHFAVADTGIGIPKEKQQLIFESFVQVDSSTTRKYGGTGLGLAICLQLVELMGGRIWLESELGKGSTFHFTARFGSAASSLEPQPEEVRPATEDKMLAEAPPVPVANRPQPECDKQARVLVVEDNEINREVLVRILQRRGHTCVVASNGREALKLIESQNPDLVLMDVGMPEMDGFETTAAIRNRDRRNSKHLPIVAITAHAMKGDRERCLAAGMDGYLSKPIRPTELINAIEGFLSPPRPEAGKTECRTEAVFDRDAALARLDGDGEMLAEVAGLFLQDCPRLLSSIFEALEREDAPALAIAAHKLKGSIANFSAPIAQQAALRLETMGRQGDLSGAEEAYSDLANELERLRPSLAELTSTK